MQKQKHEGVFVCDAVCKNFAIERSNTRNTDMIVNQKVYKIFPQFYKFVRCCLVWSLVDDGTGCRTSWQRVNNESGRKKHKSKQNVQFHRGAHRRTINKNAQFCNAIHTSYSVLKSCIKQRFSDHSLYSCFFQAMQRLIESSVSFLYFRFVN